MELTNNKYTINDNQLIEIGVDGVTHVIAEIKDSKRWYEMHELLPEIITTVKADKLLTDSGEKLYVLLFSTFRVDEAKEVDRIYNKKALSLLFRATDSEKNVYYGIKEINLDTMTKQQFANTYMNEFKLCFTMDEIIQMLDDVPLGLSNMFSSNTLQIQLLNEI